MYAHIQTNDVHTMTRSLCIHIYIDTNLKDLMCDQTSLVGSKALKQHKP